MNEVFLWMRISFLIFLFYACTSVPEPIPMTPAPLTKKTASIPEEESLYSAGLMTDYEIWEFFRENPQEAEVLETLGLPDSLWIDETSDFRILYYFVPEIQDYNSIEVDQRTGFVLGFEWD